MRKLLIIVTLIISGCGGALQPDDMPKLYPCTVIITQEGVLLTEAVVEFISAEQTKYGAMAQTDANGTAQMTTYGLPGAPIGKYKVVVRKIIAEGIPPFKKNESTGKEEPAGWNKYQMVEPKYSDAETTPHEIEIIGKSKKVEQTFDVGKAVKELTK